MSMNYRQVNAVSCYWIKVETDYNVLVITCLHFSTISTDHIKTTRESQIHIETYEMCHTKTCLNAKSLDLSQICLEFVKFLVIETQVSNAGSIFIKLVPLQ